MKVVEWNGWMCAVSREIDSFECQGKDVHLKACIIVKKLYLLIQKLVNSKLSLKFFSAHELVDLYHWYQKYTENILTFSSELKMFLKIERHFLS